MTTQSGRWFAFVIGATVTALMVAGCGTAQRDDAGAITASGAVGVEQLAVGDCVAAPSGTNLTLSDLTGVPCAQAHDGEIYLVQDLPEGDFPGSASVGASAETMCSAAADAYVGSSLSETALDIYYLFPPSADDWARSRSVACIVHHPGETVTGSLRGKGAEHLFTAAGWKVGACYGSEDTEQELVTCDRPHVAEVFATGTLPDGPFSSELVSTVMPICEKAFAAYVGAAYGTSVLDYAPVVPGEQGWAAGDRAYACALVDPNEKMLTGSARGSGS